MYKHEKTSVACSYGILSKNPSVVLESAMPRPKPDVLYKAFSVRLRDDLLASVRETARHEKRSVNAQFEMIVEEWDARKAKRDARKRKGTV